MNLKGRWVAYRGDQCVGGNSALRSRCSRVRPSGGRRELPCLCPSVRPSVTFMLMSALLLPEPALLRVCSDFHAIFANALPDIRPTYSYPLYPLIYPGTGIKEGFWSFHGNDLDLIYLLQISYTTDYISSPHPQTNTR